MNETRFTVDGSAELEQGLRLLCERSVEAARRCVPDALLEAVILGGGYGRGQGGVWRTPEGDFPYNDLEFYICVRGPRLLRERQFGPALRAAAHELSELAPRCFEIASGGMSSASCSLEVEFKLISSVQLRESAPSMFFHDLIEGHKLLWGTHEIWNGCEHHRDAEKIPLSEATRLLMNRCSGLLFAEERLRRLDFSADDADFVGRNQAKAQLAFGDVALTAYGIYDWDCGKRHARLIQFTRREKVPCLKAIQNHHAQGVQFKLHPSKRAGSAESFRERQDELRRIGLQLWLWLESRRLNRWFFGPGEYAFSGVDKCPETKPWRNRLINARTFGLAAAAGGGATRYPRERLLNVLSVLLWDEESLADSKVAEWMGRQLNATPSTFAERVKAYDALWRRFN
jgi:hypothetical protein